MHMRNGGFSRAEKLPKIVQNLRKMFESSRKIISSPEVIPLLNYRVTECVSYNVTAVDLTNSFSVQPSKNLG